MQFDRDSVNRLWDYKGQMENIFYQRASFFLLAESMLLLAFATVLPTIRIAVILILFGIVFTILWTYINWRHTAVYSHVRNRYLIQACPEYAEVMKTRPRSPVSSRKVVAYVVPGITLAAWLSLLIALLTKDAT